MRTNLQIFESIKETGFITESDLQLLKNRANRAQKDDYTELYNILDDQDIRLTPSQGAKGLKWLKSFISKRDPQTTIKGACYGYREFEIINNAKEDEFTFRGFYDAGNGWHKNFLPIYELNGMEYIPMQTPYIIG